MKLTNGKQVYDLTDSAHIDCFKAKGWKLVTEQPAKVEEQPKKYVKKTEIK